MQETAVSPYLGELIGTMILIIFGGGTVANVVLQKSKGYGSGWIVITTGWGLGVAIAAYSVGRISGAHLNPALTVALACIGSFQWNLVPGYVAAQVAGAFLGGVIVWICYLPHWRETEDTAGKLGVFCTAPAIRHTLGNLLCEIIGTAVLVFGVLAIGANAQELKSPAGLDLSLVFSKGLSFLLVGFLVWAIGLALGGPTGYAINPARDFGPRLAHALLPIAGKGKSDWGYCWVPILGPIIGGVLGALAFKALRF
jgi:glycerol uptake facilitator protein